MRVEPFEIHLPSRALDDLRRRLHNTRWPDEIEGAPWEYGVSRAYLHEVLEYWQHGFDWHAQQARLNTFPHFRSYIDGFGIHFIHQRGQGPRPMPLIITHGWPGSFVEMLPIIPLLTDPAAYGGDETDAFDVVVPSLPGYGFSDRPTSRGMNAFQIADLWARLMGGLGYDRYGAQGGDWGASVGTCLALESPSAVIGLHLNYIPGSYKPFLDADAVLSPAEQAFLISQDAWWQSEGGYAHVHRTRPQTLAYALNDSPAGLAAWMLEKFRDWSDCDGDVGSRFSKDELLTHITIYWATETMPSSMRLYYEGKLRPIHFVEGQRIDVPCGIARFAKEAPFPPREWVERSYNVQRWTEYPRGGHFAAWEEPELLAEDIRTYFRPLRRARDD